MNDNNNITPSVKFVSSIEIRDADKRNGYKKTKLGWIPEEWELGKLGDFTSKIIGGGTPSRDNHIFWNGDIPWVTVKDLSSFNSENTQEYITEDGLNNSSANLIPKGTLITSTRMALGKAVIYDVDVSINQDLKAIFPSESLLTSFLFFWFEKNSNQIKLLGTGSTVMGIQLSDLKSLSFLLPPLPEQQKIAQILGTWDKGIAQTQALIAQKQLLKKGLMQQLLTGKKRFAGFTEKWKRATISDVFEFLSTNSFSRNDLSNDVKDDSVYNIHYGDIHATYHEPILDFDKCKSIPVLASDVFPPNKADFLQDGDLIIADASEDYEGVADSIELKNVKGKKVLAGLHTFALRDKSGLTENGFRTYLLKHPKVANALKSVATGSKVYGISKANILKVELIIPSNKEQKKIGEFFSVFDEEIEHLQKQLTQLQEQKKGLMQKLLTGEVRVMIL